MTGFSDQSLVARLDKVRTRVAAAARAAGREPAAVRLVGVSKRQPAEAIRAGVEGRDSLVVLPTAVTAAAIGDGRIAAEAVAAELAGEEDPAADDRPEMSFDGLNTAYYAGATRAAVAAARAGGNVRFVARVGSDMFGSRAIEGIVTSITFDATGALITHITGGADAKTFQPMNVNFGLFPPVEARGGRRGRKDRYKAYTDRAKADWQGWLAAR